MTRFTLSIAALLLANSFFALSAHACNRGGGIRVAPRVYAPAVRYAAPVVVHRPIQTVHTVRVAQPRIVHAAPAVPQIRLAPTQRRTLAAATAPATVPTAAAQNTAPANSAAPATTGQASANPSALAILSGQQQTSQQPTSQTAQPTQPAQPTAPTHVGIWTAKANATATVTLSLNQDNSFEWVAVNNGKTSRFAGNFELSGQKLTLSRSSDNQKLAGTLSFSNRGFNFKLDGVQDAGLDFTRGS